MKVFKTKDIRNFGLYGHQGSGKTQMAEMIVFMGGATKRLHSVDQENSNFDYEDEEIKRRSSMNTAVGYGEWQNKGLNIVDTPGDTNFLADVIYSFPAVDLAVMTVSAVDGVQVGTEKYYDYIRKNNLPMIMVITKLDKERASFEQALNSIETQLDQSAIPVFIPMGEEAGFHGIIDLLKQKAYEYDGETGKGKEVDIPADMQDQVEMFREKLVEKVAEQQDDLIEKYFEEGELSPEEILQGLSTGIREGKITPVLATSVSMNIGIDKLLDFIVEFGPSPEDRKPLKAMKNEEEIEILVSVDGDFAAYVFKTMMDPQAGKATLMRVLRGELNADTSVINLSTNSKERFGQLFKVLGKKQDATSNAYAGDIVAVAKLKETRTGHTLVAEGTEKFLIKPPELPNRSIAFSIKPKTQGDDDKVGVAITKLMEEDPGLAVKREKASKEFLLEGMGQIHIESTVEKMRRKYGVDVALEVPKVPYRETITKKVTGIEGKHKKQSGGHGQFGLCYIDMEPLTNGETFEFVNDIFGGSIPRQFVPSVEKGIKDKMVNGVLAGYPVMGVKVRLFDGKYHPVDSDGRSFEMAGSKAFKDAFMKAGPVLLEPIMNIEIMVPEENTGDIIGDISSRRGRIQGTEQHGKTQVIKAKVPMSEVLVYASDLRALTSGRGTFTLEFSNYEQVPSNIAQKVIDEAKGAEADD